MHFLQLLLGFYNQHAARRRRHRHRLRHESQRQERRHKNKLSLADLDILPKFKLTAGMLLDIKRTHKDRRHLVAPHAGPPQETAAAKPRHLCAATVSLPDLNCNQGPHVCDCLDNKRQHSVIDVRNLEDGIESLENNGNLRPWHVPTETSQPNCVVCLEEYAVGDDVRVLPCGHVFHDQCITPWLLRPKSRFHECPMCKTPCFADEAARKAKEEAAMLSGGQAQHDSHTNMISVF
ncbi:hypothetical protein LPJ72_003243 [Coemansia sp. Benny D160-2]|nr:hypothetical protein LPJ72_003243 [Coemansia sp. Benny D160-2]